MTRRPSRGSRHHGLGGVTGRGNTNPAGRSCAGMLAIPAGVVALLVWLVRR